MAWQDRMRPASFRGARFKVESGGKRGGRRNVTHEFPKRDDPYSEDMGRRARRWQVTAYVIGPNYMAERDALIRACEQEGPGLLIHPTIGEEQVVCNDYGVTEVKERGGMASFDLTFVEAGKIPGLGVRTATAPASKSAADVAARAAIASLDKSIAGKTR